MNVRREGLIWEVLGFAVVIVSAWRVFAATQQFTDMLLNQKFAGNMDLVWSFGMGVFAGFFLLAGAAAMISGHAMRVLTGARHRGLMWKVAGYSCFLGGLFAIMQKMGAVSMSRQIRLAEPQDFYKMLTSGGFAIGMSGGYLLLLGIMLLSADRACTAIRRGITSTTTTVEAAAAIPIATPAPAASHPLLLAGLPMGVLGAVQIAIGLRALGFFWGIASGLLACYLMNRIHRHEIKFTEAARCGILAGVICALVTASLWLLILVGTLFFGSSGSIAILPPVSLQAVGILVVSLLLVSVLGAMFGGIGGLLGALIFRKRTVPVAG